MKTMTMGVAALRLAWLGACAVGSERALQVAYGLQAAHHGDNDTPFFVSGADQRLAALLVNRLADGGARRVTLVTP